MLHLAISACGGYVFLRWMRPFSDGARRDAAGRAFLTVRLAGAKDNAHDAHHPMSPIGNEEDTVVAETPPEYPFHSSP
jgi:hypothetical protein